MAKFDYGVLSNDEVSLFAANKKMYSKDEALELARLELKNFVNFDKLIISTGFVKCGFYNASDGEKYNGYHIDLKQKTKKRKFDIEIWLVEPYEKI